MKRNTQLLAGREGGRKEENVTKGNSPREEKSGVCVSVCEGRNECMFVRPCMSVYGKIAS